MRLDHFKGLLVDLAIETEQNQKKLWFSVQLTYFWDLKTPAEIKLVLKTSQKFYGMFIFIHLGQF